MSTPVTPEAVLIQATAEYERLVRLQRTYVTKAAEALALATKAHAKALEAALASQEGPAETFEDEARRNNESAIWAGQVVSEATRKANAAEITILKATIAERTVAEAVLRQQGTEAKQAKLDAIRQAAGHKVAVITEDWPEEAVLRRADQIVIDIDDLKKKLKAKEAEYAAN
jgi:hypothetical protein